MLMRLFVAIIMGFLSALVLSFLVMLISAAFLPYPGPGFAIVAFLIAWPGSAWIISRCSRSVSKVLSRGFLIGAAEWFALIFVMMVVGASPKISGASSDLNPVEGTLVGGAIGMVVAIPLAIVCLIGFVISHFAGKELKREF